MRLILSRKGFDSAAGGCASPILPGGRLVSLPIPAMRGTVRYGELAAGFVRVADLVRDLTGGRHGPGDRAHLDPDLDRASCSRLAGWRPAFGQAEGQQTHLANQGVGIGDLFLFFGWFRAVELSAGSWRYRRGAPDLHVLFGWLQVGDAVDLVADRDEGLRRHPGLARHPHFASDATPNVLYLGARWLTVAGAASRRVRGAGLFQSFHEELVLTQAGRSRSRWRLPRWFHPEPGRRALTCHEDPGRWSRDASGTLVRSVPRGQEFVLHAADYPEAAAWAGALVARHG
jgi:hypothetical protein